MPTPSLSEFITSGEGGSKNWVVEKKIEQAVSKLATKGRLQRRTANKE